MIRLIAIIVILTVVIWGIKKLINAGALFTITIGHRDIALKGTVPGRHGSEVKAFMKSLNLPAGAVIRGYPGSDRFRLVFSSELDAAVCQRVRNFLYLNAR